ncbi:N-acetylmuramoyl-L-alanine amidase family protein [Algivirga pacifica]
MKVTYSFNIFIIKQALLVALTIVGFITNSWGQPPVSEITKLQEYYQQRANRFLVKDAIIHEYYKIHEKGISMYASPEDKKADKPEFHLAWDELERFKDLIEYTDRNLQFALYQRKGTRPFNIQENTTIEILKRNHYLEKAAEGKKKLPLSGIRIAIDPGHIAGDMDLAKAEGRFIEMNYKGNTYKLKEGDLTLSTAMVLKDSLEKQGAKVFISRDQPNQGANGKPYEVWKKTDLTEKLKDMGLSSHKIQQTLLKSPEYRIYREYFLQDDLELRAAEINYFKPHLTIVIHYNADDKNFGWKQPSKRNFGMVFVPGAFLKYEMRTPRDRYDFIRVLVSEQVKESSKLSAHVMQAFENKLQVPAVSKQEEPAYLQKLAIRLDKGVYARNLRLCRLLNTPICYGEPLFQDNELELKALNGNNLKEGKISSRVVQVANAYYEGIMKYLSDSKILTE